METNKKEKLIITCELDSLPEDAKIVDFRIVIIQDGIITRLFKNWKKINFIRVPITKMTVEK